MNPWKLNPDQEKLMALLTEGHCDKVMARMVDVSPVAIRCRLERAREKMGATNRVAAAVLWDRYVRQDAKQ